MKIIDSEKLTQWLNEQIQAVHYGEIGIKIICHDGQVRTLEKTVTQKEHPGVTNA